MARLTCRHKNTIMVGYSWVGRLDHYVTLNAEASKDILWWNEFVSLWNGINYPLSIAAPPPPPPPPTP